MGIKWIRHLQNIIFLSYCFSPALTCAQSLLRPDHILPQYEHDGATIHSVADLSRDTQVPSAYMDGSTATLGQIARMADGSVQQVEKNVAGGVAGLNENGEVVAPLANNILLGTAGSPIFSAEGHVSLNDALNDMYLHNMGIRKTDSVFDTDGISAVYYNKDLPSRTLRLSANEHYPTGLKMPPSNYNRFYIHADGQLLTPAAQTSEAMGNPAWNGGHLSQHTGDSILVEDYEPKFGIVRDRQYDSNDIFSFDEKRKPAAITSDFMTINSQWSRSEKCGSDPYNPWCSSLQMGTPMHSNILKSTSNVGVGITSNFLQSTGFGYGGAYDVENFEKFYAGGTNWHWITVNEVDEIDHMTTGGYLSADGRTIIQSGAKNYNNEWDMAGYGPEDPRTAYDPGKSTRIPFWFNTWYPGPEPIWEPNARHHAFEVIVITKSNGSKYMYEATVENGVSDIRQPHWSFDEITSFVRDGTQQWVYVGPKRFEIGRVFGIGGADGTRFGTLMSSDATYYNAIFDFATTRFSVPTHVWARLPSNTYLDMTADGTASGQNNHLLGYDARKGRLTYKVKGIAVAGIGEDGAYLSSAPVRLPVMRREQIRAYRSPVQGMEIYDSDDDTPAVYTRSGWKLVSLSAMPDR